jgi:predicted 3-demethylubiquinone-9 3-methyltransferase (glyoxalase superfamily)
MAAAAQAAIGQNGRMPATKPCLWFDGLALDAATFYVSVFPNSSITDVSHYDGDKVLMVEFSLDGVNYQALNGGPHFTFNEAVSFSISCTDQAEADYFWDALTADGGVESQCGWLKDKFGVSWQVVPQGLAQVLMDPDPARAQRAMAAMMGMKRLDLAAMIAAADAVPTDPA